MESSPERIMTKGANNYEVGQTFNQNSETYAAKNATEDYANGYATSSNVNAYDFSSNKVVNNEFSSKVDKNYSSGAADNVDLKGSKYGNVDLEDGKSSSALLAELRNMSGVSKTTSYAESTQKYGTTKK